MSPAVDLSHPDNSEYDKGRPFLIQVLWHYFGLPILRAHLLPVSALKCFWLRLFGAKIGKGVYVKPGVRVKYPWYLTVGDYCWLGEDLWIDNLAPVIVGSHVCLSQAAYLCTGNHDWSSPNMKLFRRPITLADGSWVGARAVVCPGVTIGSGSIVAAGSVATKSVPDWQIWAGNPATFLRQRRLRQENARAEVFASPQTRIQYIQGVT